MANDVSIIVSADLGDTLIKLDLAKHAVKDLGDQSEETAAKQDAAAASSGFFESALSGLNSVLMANIPLLGGMSVPLIALPALAGAAATGVIALADAVGTLVAIVADFIAPATVVLGLLGGLGIAFGIAAKKAFGMHEDGFGKAIAGLKDQFDQLTHTLVGDFMPVFQFLIHNAHDALDFLNRIAKLPLDEAFKKLAQQGIPAITKFLGQVGHIVARPIRLAFQIAFGTGKAGNEAQQAVSNLWNQLSNFLFGYSKTHVIRLDGRVFKIDKQHVDGIFQPLIDWFNRHNFSKQGEKIGHQMLDGFMNSGVARRMGQFLVQILEDAIKTIAQAAKDHLGYHLWPVIQQLAGKAWDAIKSEAGDVWGWIRDKAGGIISSIQGWITGKLSSAWDTVKTDALNAWNYIKRLFSHSVDLVVNIVAHIPSALENLIGNVGNITGLGGSGSASTAPGRGRLGAQGANVVMHNNFHFHAATGADRGQFRRFAHEMGRELDRQRGIIAGGV